MFSSLRLREKTRNIRVVSRILTQPAFALGFMGCVFLSATSRLHKLEIGSLKVERIGHFVMDTSIQFFRQNSDPDSKRIFWVDPAESPANSFWLELVKRNLRVSQSRVIGLVVRVAEILPRPPKWFLPPPWHVNGSRDFEGLFSKAPNRMEFTALEDEAGHAWLESIGCAPDQPFVCLLVRDSAYLADDPRHSPTVNSLSSNFWDYHSYRDSQISSFLLAAEWLAERGFFVFRMGRIMEEEFSSNRSGIVDYAFHPDRSDFLDVWLFANCSFCVTTGSGPDVISQAFGKSTVAVNYIPLANNSWISVPVLRAGKALYDRNGRRLSLEQHLTLNLTRTQDYLEKEVTIRDLSAEEIKSVVIEGYLRLNNQWEEKGDESEIQQRFRQVLTKSFPKCSNVFFHPESRLSTEWVRQLEMERLSLR